MTNLTRDLIVTLIQPDILWQNARENLGKYSEMLASLSGRTDLIVLPEMFQTGFCTAPEGIAETMDGDSVRWMKRTAEALGCAIAGSLIIRENRRFFNRLVYIDQYENLTWYDKRHLFRMAGEETRFTAGMERLVVPLKDWRISFQICYDLRFPVWGRNQDDYDVLVNVANWPEARNDVWNTLLKARALENQCYAIGVNRIGKDGNGIAYSGNSAVYHPKGTVVAAIAGATEDALTCVLSGDELLEFREKFPAWKDRDDFRIMKRKDGRSKI